MSISQCIGSYDKIEIICIQNNSVIGTKIISNGLLYLITLVTILLVTTLGIIYWDIL